MNSEVTETELAVLHSLWEHDELTSSEVAELLYDEVSDPKRSSAQKLLDRLVWKGCVERDRSRRPHRFRSLVSKEEFTGHRVQALANKLYGGSISPVLTSLVQSEQLSKKDIADLRQLIDDLSPSSKRTTRSRKG